jgi:uncharacterized protein CbrC (UPF0167 family)
MTADQPFFRFYPYAYDDPAVFEHSGDRCDVCRRPCVWRYNGSLYATTEPSVCARCITDGRLGAFLREPHHSLQDVEICGADPAMAEEVLQRTPGVASYNPFEWPVFDGKPLAFIGYGDNEAVIAAPGVKAMIEQAFADLGWTSIASRYALVFREVDGQRYRVVPDFD